MTDAERSEWRERARRLGSMVCVATADWDAPLWTNKQHLMSRLAQEMPVLYVNSLGLREPRPTRADARRVLARLRALRHGGQVVTRAGRNEDGPTIVAPSVIPFHRFALVRAVNRRLLSRSLRAHIKRLPRPITLWTYNPAVVDELDLADFDRVVYHAVDDYATTPGIPARAVRGLEERLVQKAERVFATSPALADRFAALAPGRTVLLPNVADADHFGTARLPGPVPEDLLAIPSPRVVYTGALSDHKVDWGLVEEVARRLPSYHFVLIGPLGEEQAATGHSSAGELNNVHILGARPYAVLPNYLRGAYAAIIPYRVSEHTDSVFPMKVWEYLAAGVPVISTPLAAVIALNPPVAVAGSAENFVQALTDVDRSEAAASQRQVAASSNTWDRNLAQMLRELS